MDHLAKPTSTVAGQQDVPRPGLSNLPDWGIGRRPAAVRGKDACTSSKLSEVDLHAYSVSSRRVEDKLLRSRVDPRLGGMSFVGHVVHVELDASGAGATEVARIPR